MMVVFLMSLLLALSISMARNRQEGIPMQEENLNRKKLAEAKEHKKTLDNIISTLREEHRKGNLEELLVYYSLESEQAVHRFFTLRTGRTLHQIMEWIDEFARERRNLQN